MSSVVVPLIGGLGNQMFQYAAGRALALRTNSALDLDLSWFGTDPSRQYALEPFLINATTSRLKQGLRLKPHIFHRLTRKIPTVFTRRWTPIFKEASFCYDQRIEKLTTPVILEGYFQSEKYFSSFSNQIAKEFELRNAPDIMTKVMVDKISCADSICVHIRRGDYVSNTKANAHHGTCSLDYYKEGISMMARGLSNPHCFVFSDDPAWVTSNFPSFLPTTFVNIHTANQAHEDLRLMSACRRFVIANSSLSWWGAWLGTNIDKKVVAPAKWFKKDGIDTGDLIPSNWTKL